MQIHIATKTLRDIRFVIIPVQQVALKKVIVKIWTSRDTYVMYAKALLIYDIVDHAPPPCGIWGVFVSCSVL